MSFKRSRNCSQFASTWVFPRYFGGIRVEHLFSFCCCPIMFLYVLNSILWSPLRFLHRNDVRFAFISSCSYEGSWLIYVINVCLCLVVSNTYYVVFSLCFSPSCVPDVACFSGMSFFDCPIRYSLTFICNLTIFSSSVIFCLFLEHLLRCVFIIIISLSFNLIGVRRRRTENSKPASSNWHITHPYRQPPASLMQLIDNRHYASSYRKITHIPCRKLISRLM